MGQHVPDSTVRQQMGLSNIKEVLVFSYKPNEGIIEFCSEENIRVIWKHGNAFKIFNGKNELDGVFNPDSLI